MGHVVYFDEIKNHPDEGRHIYFVGGLAIPIEKIGEVEEQLHELAKSEFDSRELVPATEF